MTRQKILAVNFYDILQTYHGGSLCVRGLNKALSKWFDVTLVTFHDDIDILFNQVWMNKHFCVVPLAKPKKLNEREKMLYVELGIEKIGMRDPSIPASLYYAEVPEFVKAIQKLAEDSIIVITEHPYTYNLLKHAMPEKCIWYRAHNVEYEYKNMVWQHSENHEALLKEVYALEKECCEGCDLILTITQEDADRFHTLYNIPKSKLLNISAGIDISSFVLPSERKTLMPRYKALALFLSSYAEASADAARKVLELAHKTPTIMYYMVGSVCHAIEPDSMPPNLRLMGIVSEEDKEKYLKQADFALNMIESGSGMNVKMLEYFAFGLPVITTEFGVRGISVVDRTHCIITDIEHVAGEIESFCSMSISERDFLAKNAYDLVKKDYSWDTCVNRILKFLSESNKRLYDSVLTTAPYDEQLDITAHEEKLQLDKTRKYYIFGAGKFGEKNIDVLKSLGITPDGIIDNNPKLWGNRLHQINIYPPKKYYQESNADIIVAVNIHYAVDILRQLVDNSVARERIYIDLGGDGIYPCGVRTGSQNHFYDFEKIITLKERGWL